MRQAVRCWELARSASHDLLLFLDADVRLHPDGVARLAAFLQESEADLVRGIPHQETVTLLERLLISLIHFVLLGFLPMGRMRASQHPAYAARCGQLFLTRRSSYEKVGGHVAIRATLHDGIQSMNILVTGASGLVGSSLVPFLTTGGHAVQAAVRSPREGIPVNRDFHGPIIGALRGGIDKQP